jgi:reverse gyrase
LNMVDDCQPAGTPSRCRCHLESPVCRMSLCALAECSELHLEMQFKYNAGMSTSTVGFAVADEDRERLERLVEHFGGGNRSAYLRATLTVMESLARAERLCELQARNAERAAAAGQDYESLLAEIRRAYKDGAREH